MDPKKRTILVVAIAITIIAGVLSSFGLPFLLQAPTITIPSTGEIGQTGDGTDGLSTDVEGNYASVKVTQETVQAVVATLHRNKQYYRELSVEHWGSDSTSSTTTILIWQDGSFTKTATMTPDGTLESSITTEDTVYLWYSGDRNYYQYPRDEYSADLLQRSPTYEDILRLDTQTITATNYERKLGQPCIYVEVFVKELGYTERYWISTTSGLLISSETERDGKLVYRMTETVTDSISSNGTEFALPDGTVLHRVLITEAEE